MDCVIGIFTIVTKPKASPVNNDCAGHQGLCGCRTGDLFHCKWFLYTSKRKQASLIYMRKSESTLRSRIYSPHKFWEAGSILEIACPLFIFRAIYTSVTNSCSHFIPHTEYTLWPMGRVSAMTFIALQLQPGLQSGGLEQVGVWHYRATGEKVKFKNQDIQRLKWLRPTTWHSSNIAKISVQSTLNLENMPNFNLLTFGCDKRKTNRKQEAANCP